MEWLDPSLRYFFEELELSAKAGRIALIDGDDPGEKAWTYAAVLAEAKTISENLRPASDRTTKSLVFCLCDNSVQSILTYLGALMSGHAVTLFDGGMNPDLLIPLIKTYKPRWVIGALAGPDEILGRLSYGKISGIPGRELKEGGPTVHPSLTLLLPSSGTTGSPKLIRLSSENLITNAKAIIEYLTLTTSERAPTTLPIYYSFGLSILHTHLLCGGSLYVTRQSVISAGFWKGFKNAGCTSISGVPYFISILLKIGAFRKLPTSVRMVTQAGGKLDQDVALRVNELLAPQNIRLFVMYGQTEASPRIAYLPPASLASKPGSIGVPIPGGKIWVRDKHGKQVTEPHATGELIYEGSNVMLGYAESLGDLALGDLMNGLLPTGDLGYFDESGYFFITGRMKRFSKAYGLRISLDELEQSLQRYYPVAAKSDDQKIVVFMEEPHKAKEEAVRTALSERFKLNANTFEIRFLESIPLTATGKIAYQQLEV